MSTSAHIEAVLAMHLCKLNQYAMSLKVQGELQISLALSYSYCMTITITISMTIRVGKYFSFCVNSVLVTVSIIILKD